MAAFEQMSTSLEGHKGVMSRAFEATDLENCMLPRPGISGIQEPSRHIHGIFCNLPALFQCKDQQHRVEKQAI